MSILHSTFSRFFIEYDGPDFRDIEFKDASPKSQLRHWILSIDKKNPEKTHGTLMRFKTVDDDFGQDIELPSKMVTALIQIAGATAEVAP